jgi:hypothetical protein
MRRPPGCHDESFERSTIIVWKVPLAAYRHSNHRNRYQKYLSSWLAEAEKVTGYFRTFLVRHTDCVCGCSV